MSYDGWVGMPVLGRARNEVVVGRGRTTEERCGFMVLSEREVKLNETVMTQFLTHGALVRPVIVSK